MVHGVAVSSAATTAEDGHSMSSFLHSLCLFECVVFSELTQVSHQVGSGALAYLALLKQDKPDMGAIETTGSQLKTSIQALSKLVEVTSG